MPVSLKAVAMLFAGYILLASCSAASAAMLAVISEDDNFENSQQSKCLVKVATLSAQQQCLL